MRMNKEEKERLDQKVDSLFPETVLDTTLVILVGAGGAFLTWLLGDAFEVVKSSWLDRLLPVTLVVFAALALRRSYIREAKGLVETALYLEKNRGDEKERRLGEVLEVTLQFWAQGVVVLRDIKAGGVISGVKHLATRVAAAQNTKEFKGLEASFNYLLSRLRNSAPTEHPDLSATRGVKTWQDALKP